jgi:hypothetical protein
MPRARAATMGGMGKAAVPTTVMRALVAVAKATWALHQAPRAVGVETTTIATGERRNDA